MSGPTISRAELAALRRLLDEVATKGPWRRRPETLLIDTDDGRRALIADADWRDDSVESAGNAELIAAAINALPALLAIAEAHDGDREAAWLEYIQFLIEANRGPIQLAWAHGWRCSDEDIAKGKELRARLGLGDDNRPLPAQPEATQ